MLHVALRWSQGSCAVNGDLSVIVRFGNLTVYPTFM